MVEYKKCKTCVYFGKTICNFDGTVKNILSTCHVKLYEIVNQCLLVTSCEFCAENSTCTDHDREKPHGRLVIKLHYGQGEAYTAEEEIVAILAGTGGGKTDFGAIWLKKKMDKWGSGDYMVVSPSYPLQNLALRPAYKRFFIDTLGIGKYRAADKQITVKYEGIDATIFFASADKPESLESAVVNAVHLDEPGQDKFKLAAWEAIQRRVAHKNGDILMTTCYDDKTEIYTDSGWKLLGNLTDIDKVYAPNENGAGVFEHPYRRTWERYKGKMFHFSGGRIDLCVTPNHRILYKNHSRFYINDAEHFSKLSHRTLTIPKTIHPQLKLQKYFILPSLVLGHRWGDIINRPAIKIPMADWCAFIGWFLSEGCVTGCKGGSTENGKYHIICSQNDGDKWRIMKEDLDKLPFQWHKEGNSYVTSNKQLWSYLKIFGNCSQKYIPKELKHAGKDNLLILIDRMVQGDGSYLKTGHVKYYTTSKQLADDFREVCMLVGISTGIKQHASQPFQGTSGNFKPIYHIWQRKRQSGIITHWEEIDYDGNIGCVGTSTGLVLVRRNGEECICGNTIYNFGWMIREIYDRWKQGDKRIHVIQFDSLANPVYSTERYETAKRTLPKWKFDMQYRGIPSRPAGQIYSVFDESIHIIDPFPIPLEWNWDVSIDPGAVHTAIGWIAKNSAENKYYIVRAYLDGNKTTKEHVAKAKTFPEFGRVTRWVGGAGSENQFRMDWQAQGVHVKEPEIRDVESGIDAVTALLKENRLFIFDTEENQPLIEQFRSYSRQLDDAGQATDKIQDKTKAHYMDMIRYFAVGTSGRFNSDRLLIMSSRRFRERWHQHGGD